MEEVFQNFEHFKEWILKNWQTDAVLDSVIIKNGLMIERQNNCNGESYRMLTKGEFNKRDSQNFIKIPTIYESDDYQDGHRLAEQELDEIDDL
jgi:hypothetical protein